MKDKDLDRIDQGIKALIDEMEKQGHVGFISYCIQTTDEGEFQSQLVSTKATPSHYFMALKMWVNMIYKHFLDIGA